jgi:hypothetical protein
VSNVKALNLVNGSELDVYLQQHGGRPVTVRGEVSDEYGKRPGCSWDDDPWVWVVEFRSRA